MSWFFYSKEGKLLYDVVAGSLGDADTLDGIDSSGFVRIGAPGLNPGNVDLDGSLTLPLNNITADTPLTSAHRIVLVNSAAAPRLITLPASPLTGQIYEIRDQGNTGVGNSATNNITIDPNGKNIDGSGANLVLNQNGVGIIIAYNGFNWVTLADRTVSAGGAINADTLDTLDSLQFLRSDVADNAAGSITFNEVTQFDKSTYGPVTATAVNLLLDNTHRTVLVDPNGAIRTITLPASPVSGQWYEIRDVGNGGAGDASNFNITIARNGNNIDGVASDEVLDIDGDVVILVSDGFDWYTVARRFVATVITAAFDDLTDVTLTAPADGEIVRYDNGTGQWNNVPEVTVDSATGRINVLPASIGSGITLGGSSGFPVLLTGETPSTLRITGRTAHDGTQNTLIKILENGIVPAGDTYDVELPADGTLFANMNAGDIFVRLPNSLNTVFIPLDGDSMVVKDVEGGTPANTLAMVAEGVRRRNVPLLQATTTVGGPTVTITTTTPGGIGVDEEQSYQVSGGTSFKVTFDGQEAAAVLLTASATGADLVTAINSLSPHTNYGHFSVSTTTPAALVSVGVPITFDGGALIDGEADFYATVPFQSMKAVYHTGNWFLI